MVAALVFFLANTLPISIVISLTEGKSSRKVVVGMLLLVFSLLPGRSCRRRAGRIINRQAGWETFVTRPASHLLGLTALTGSTWDVWKPRKDRVEIEKRHVEEIASLNCRTIEALALAIEPGPHYAHSFATCPDLRG